MSTSITQGYHLKIISMILLYLTKLSLEVDHLAGGYIKQEVLDERSSEVLNSTFIPIAAVTNHHKAIQIYFLIILEVRSSKSVPVG
jgi:hypothetical protein